MALTPSPFAPKTYPVLHPVDGVRFATAQAGIKYKGRTDVLLVALDEGTEVAGVLTRSRCPSAAIDWCRPVLAAGKARGLLVNSGNANAFTGIKGRETVEISARATASSLGCDPDTILLASTGVIGEPLDPMKFTNVLGTLAADLTAQDKADETTWLAMARAIMTTDTFPKLAGRRIDMDGQTITLNGIAKGSGMIAPDMATMLSFLFTDAPIAAPVLDALLREAVDPSFNAITVDGDTSTSDTLILFATGAATARGMAAIHRADDPRLEPFKAALKDLCIELAQAIVRDGEGVSKFVTIHVKGATDNASAKRIALSIANSPLVKTAIAGEDANWGRIVMAVGKAGEPADRDRLAIWFADIKVAALGEREPGYREEAASAVMKQDDIPITVDLGLGQGEATVWTCDLTHGYIAINGDYRS